MTALLLPVGNDITGQQIIEELQRMGFDARRVVCCGHRSCYGIYLADKKGDHAGRDAQIVRDTVNQSRPCSLYARLEISPTSVAAFAAAHQSGIYIVLNPSPRQPLAPKMTGDRRCDDCQYH